MRNFKPTFTTAVLATILALGIQQTEFGMAYMRNYAFVLRLAPKWVAVSFRTRGRLSLYTRRVRMGATLNADK